MGFRNGAYATIWPHTNRDGNECVVNLISDRLASAKISIRKKSKTTGEYVTEFNRFVKFVGTAAVQKARSLRARDRIRLVEVDCAESTSRSDSEQRYLDFIIYDFEVQDQNSTDRYSRPTGQGPYRGADVDDGGYAETNHSLPF